ncbi:MAG: dTDP-4-dehydrorhamnose reductase [Gammaproteobacteria bacterium]|nr:dTDP-4-dehydrorhamnose reductase [Gammaproteobacteria bacterium]
MVNKNTVPVILVIGKDGQVGWELQRSMSVSGRVVAVGRANLDLSDSDNIRSVIREIKPDIIINAAAYTAVDKAEEEQDLAHQINGIAPGVMAEEAQALNALLIHYSTDYVFSGSKDIPYNETDQPDPVNVYGFSKLAGEEAIQAVNCNYLILRASWVFASRGNNFLLSMLRLAGEREELNIVGDQIGAPTSARLVADATSYIVRCAYFELKQGRFKSGLYHLASAGETSWHGFAQRIIQSARSTLSDRKIIVKDINPIKTTEYPTPAKRPLNSRLSTNELRQRFGVYLPDWGYQVDLSIQELG